MRQHILEKFYHKLEHSELDQEFVLIDNSGVVYEWDRGLVAISPQGEIKAINLDEEECFYLHASGSRMLARELGREVPYELNPQKVGLLVSKEEITLMQFEGASCHLFFPNSLSAIQLEKVFEEILPRPEFSYTYFWNGEAEEKKTAKEILKIAVNITDLSKGKVLKKDIN